MTRKILIVVNAEWYFYSHRRPLALALRSRGYDVVVAAGVERGRREAIEAEGFRFIPLELGRRSMNPARELGSFLALRRLYMRERPDVVHHFTIKPVIYGSLAARLASVPAVINTIPGLGWTFHGSGLGRRLLRRVVEAGYRLALSGRAVQTIFQNGEDRDDFVAKGLVRSDRATVVRGSGVNVTEFQPSPEPPGEPVVVLPSRLLWDKGVGEFVEAARLLRARRSGCRMVLVGGPDAGNPNSVPAETLSRWNEEGAVEWWGLRTDMPDVLARSTLVVLPSYGEGVPKALLEGAASGRPLVATDTRGCREIVHDGFNGLLVPVRDSVALADAVERLLREPETRRSMGIRSRELAVGEFGEARILEETLAVYDRALAGSPAT